MSPVEAIGSDGTHLVTWYEGQVGSVIAVNGAQVEFESTKEGFKVTNSPKGLGIDHYGANREFTATTKAGTQGALQLQNGQWLRPITLEESTIIE